MPLIFGNSNLPIDTKTLSINTLFPHQKDEWLWFGVFAVRHGPVLAENLRAKVIGQPLQSYKAQGRALALMRVGDGSAIGSRGFLQMQGRLTWRVKDWIDQRFMDRFRELPMMAIEQPKYHGTLRSQTHEPVMRCGGCGAKLGADILQRVLHRLDIHTTAQTQTSIGEDAAVVNFGGSDVVMSCDGFRSMIDDPWLFGRIVAHHALNDLYAMGTEPTVAMAMVTIPYMSDELMEDDLYQVMSGALSVFNGSEVELVGGHTAEGAELTLGFSVYGPVVDRTFEKSSQSAWGRSWQVPWMVEPVRPRFLVLWKF